MVPLNQSTKTGINFTARFPYHITYYRIEGYITHKDNPLEEVTVQLIQDGQIIQETTSASDGWYQFTGLTESTTYTVAPSNPCEYSFTPSQQTITIGIQDVLNVNFTARKLFFSIYGKVSKEDGTPIPNVIVTLGGQNNEIFTTVTDSDGDYSFGSLPNGIYNIEVSEQYCIPENGLTTIPIFCEDREMNFVCSEWVLERKEEEKAVIAKEVKSVGREASSVVLEESKNAVANYEPNFGSLTNEAISLPRLQTKQSSTSQTVTSPQIETQAAESTTTYYFYHWDHLGTARLITDNSGNIVSRHDYEPYGVEIPPYNEAAQNSHKFTGHERDETTGFDYMHFRYYGSNIGRFMKPDNVTGSPLNPQNWNLYSYVRGQPR